MSPGSTLVKYCFFNLDSPASCKVLLNPGVKVLAWCPKFHPQNPCTITHTHKYNFFKDLVSRKDRRGRRKENRGVGEKL